MKKLLILIVLSTACMGFKKPKPLTIENLRNEIYAYKIEHADIVLAQAILETGWLKCTNCCLDVKNVFGWSHDGKTYIKFKHWDESVAMYKLWQTDNYTGGDYYAFLKKSGYASDSLYVEKLRDIVKSLSKK